MFSLKSVIKMVLFFIAFCSVSILAQVIVPVDEYPFISITPANPLADKDSVTLDLVLGSASNSCMAPTFTDISFKIEQSPLTIWPPIYYVDVSYTLVPVPPTKICTMIYAPVDYGPLYLLGKLSLGTYYVKDLNTKQQVGNFSVVNVLQGETDTVTVTPQKPTTKDSLYFDLYNAGRCCVTEYYHQIVTIADTTIILSFEYDDSACAGVRCFVPGSHALFACGPQKAGVYSIYKSESPYCSGPICPAILGPIMIKRVGEVVVSRPTPVLPEIASSKPAGKPSMAVLHSPSGTFLQLYLDRAQRISIDGYSTNGIYLGGVLSGQFLSSGAHSFKMDIFPGINGVIVLSVRGETVFFTQKVQNVR